MGKFDGVLLVSDICDTLIDTKDASCNLAPVSDQDRQALEYFTSEGGRFTAATGRGLNYILPYRDSIPINAPVVMGDGAALWDIRSGEYLALAALDERAMELGQAVLDRFSTTRTTARHLDGSFYTVQLDGFARLLMSGGHDVLVVPSLLDAPLPMQNLQFRDQRNTLEELQDVLRAQDADGAYELAFIAKTQLQMTARGSGKGNMVRLLAERLGVSMEHVYCAGNGDDDVSMLIAVKEGFAPENCTQAVRDCGATVLPCKAGHGLMEKIIENLGQRY